MNKSDILERLVHDLRESWHDEASHRSRIARMQSRALDHYLEQGEPDWPFLKSKCTAAFWSAKLQQRLDAPEAEQILDRLLGTSRMADMLSDQSTMKPLMVDLLTGWICHRSTRLSRLIETSSHRIYLAVVPMEVAGRRFRSCLLRFAPTDYVIVASQKLRRAPLIDATMSELDRITDEPRPIEHATTTADATVPAKTALASWIGQGFPLRGSNSAIIDAGTSCLEVFRVFLEQSIAEHTSSPTFVTNNLLALDEWRRHVTRGAPGTPQLRMFGSRLNPEHQAFYDGDVRGALMAKSIHATHVVIGLNSMYLDRKGGVLCGFLAGAGERRVKELLFARSTTYRIIVLGPGKLGPPRGESFNLLDLRELDCDATTYIVTIAPEHRSPGEKHFLRCFEAFCSPSLQKQFRRRKLRMNWITLMASGRMAKVVKQLSCQQDVQHEPPLFAPVRSDPEITPIVDIPAGSPVPFSRPSTLGL